MSDPHASLRPHLALTLLSIGIVILLLQFMQPVLIPLVLGALLFYALDPAVDWLQRMHVPRAIGAAFMLLLVVVGVRRARLFASGPGADGDRPAAGRRAQARRVAARRPRWPHRPRSRKCSRRPMRCRRPTKPAPPQPGVLRVQVEEEGFQRQLVRLVELDRSAVGGESARDGAVPDLLHAAVRPTLQAQARRDRRHALAEEADGAGARRHRRRRSSSSW